MREPTPPPDLSTIAYVFCALGLVLFGVFQINQKPIDMREFGGELEDHGPFGWGCVAVGTAGGVAAAVARSRARRRYAAAMQAHAERLDRLVPAWGQVEASELGERLLGRSDSGPDPLIGYRVSLALTVWTSREPGPQSRVSVAHAFEPHVATALAPGSWIEMGFDPRDTVIVPQHVVTRDGAKLPVVPVG
ncbi:hypothetical protein [Nannocystis bainbridge]|uniref:DUF3592 domain-containing protein n=1 Tax=Nannocystis bainbridge TaxID=2995303 RepID=A0ABT5EB87_9BACT|nr:hypothetical protein [Nannocystis bainbridge]MDC0723143.1 hypothetical protein [Nannocystis bainbridge]